MGNRSKQRAPRQARPVNPGQQELAIMRRMMEDAIAQRVRIEDMAREIARELSEVKFTLAAVLFQLPDHTAILPDNDLEDLSLFAGFESERNETEGTSSITLVLSDRGEDEPDTEVDQDEE